MSTFVVYPAASGSGPFALPFPYLDRDHVKAYAVAATGALSSRAFTFATSTTASLTVGATSETILFRRETPVVSPSRTFQPGAVSAADLNAQVLQLLYRTQELADESGQALEVPYGETPFRVPALADRTGIAYFDPLDASRPLAAASLAPGSFVGIAADGRPVALSGTGSDAALRTDLAASGGLALSGFNLGGTGSRTRTALAKAREVQVSASDFTGWVGDNVSNDAVPIQAAVDYVASLGGGRVTLPAGSRPFIGTTTIVGTQNVIIDGQISRYGGATPRGTTLRYTGTGAAIQFTNALDAGVENLDIDISGATGPNKMGIYLKGAWKCVVRRVTVRGLDPNAVCFRVDTNPTAFGDGSSPSHAWGAQHNDFEMIEFDGFWDAIGVDGNTGVTTTTVTTARGFKYRAVSSQILFTNATAEAWPSGNGYEFSGVGCECLMVACDIENQATPVVGVKVNAPAVVREIGTVWLGFSTAVGNIRVDGEMGSLRSYGGPFNWIRALTNGVLYPVELVQSREFNFTRRDLIVTEQGGGAQNGYMVESRAIGGTVVPVMDQRDFIFDTRQKTVASISPTVLFRVPVPNGEGVYLDVHVYGTQNGNAVFGSQNRAVVRNSANVLNLAADVALDTGGGNPLSFVINGTNIDVTVTPGSATSSVINASIIIRGRLVAAPTKP